MIVGWIFINLGILIGIVIISTIGGLVLGIIVDKDDAGTWIGGIISGFVVGIILSIIGFMISLLIWGFWLVNL